MSKTFPEDRIATYRDQLADHPVYSALETLEDLQIFMSHHVYSVWDFMSLCKFLQGELAPTSIPWKPGGHPSARRFINEIVIEEESDEALPDADGNPTYLSHFELYCGAMKEIGADSSPVKRFVEQAASEGIRAALDSGVAPAASRNFVDRTFQFIETGKPHLVAAAFTLGREHIIPAIFRSLLDKMEVTDQQAPIFHYYLKRHIHLDEDFHAPLSLLLLNELCKDDATFIEEAVEAADAAIEARLAFWDGVLGVLEKRER